MKTDDRATQTQKYLSGKIRAPYFEISLNLAEYWRKIILGSERLGQKFRRTNVNQPLTTNFV